LKLRRRTDAGPAKAKALSHCDLPNELKTKPWHTDPGIIGFLKDSAGRSYVATHGGNAPTDEPLPRRGNIILAAT